MDDRTERLRDLFVEATGEREVSERSAPDRGSLPADGHDEDSVRRVVADMRERYDFSTDLTDEALVTVARLFFEGAADAATAATLDTDPASVFEARLDLHLVSATDREVPFDAERCRGLFDDGHGDEDAAEALGADPAPVARYRRVLAADHEALRANERWRDRFSELLTDADLSTNHAASAREDGLREATEDIETDVEF